MPRTIIPLQPIHDEPEQPSRRTLVKWLAASVALSAAGCSRPPPERIYSYAHMPEIEGNGDAVPQFYASACTRRGHAQGVLIGTQQGRPVKVEGNLLHPASLGGAGVFEQAAILQLWDPDRSTVVWQRAADGRARPSTWPAFGAAWNRQAASAPVHVLASPFTSPTLAAQLAQLIAQRPGSRWYVDDTAAEQAARRGAAMAFGRAVRAVHRLDRAELVVALGGDPFSDAAAGLRHSADWARSRAEAIAARRAPARLVALETTPGLFGARADERWALAPPALDAVLWRVASALLPLHAGTDENVAPIADRLVALLQKHRGRAVVYAGSELAAESHALVHALNHELGAFDHAVDLIEPPEMHAGVLPPPGSLVELTQAMRQGEVQTLLLLGANPLYTAPAALRFGEALAQVPLSIHHGTQRDETAERCAWHLPSGHEFEQWSDARAFDGTATLMQPAIAPLYDTRSAHELVAMLSASGSSATDGHARVRDHWRGLVGETGFDAFWTASLRRGFVEGSAAPALRLAPAALPAAPAAFDAAPDAVWCVFPPDPSAGHGEHANNGWLQELPRPFTQIAWGNALQFGPRTAVRLGLVTGDVARVRGDAGAVVDAPVWVQAGHAEGAATLHGGHGRSAAGRVGNGVGVDNAALRSADRVAVPVQIERIGGGHRFTLTQVELGQHGRELARVLPQGAALAPSAPLPTLYAAEPQSGPAWGMAIDLDACIGCNACTIACQAENNIPVVGPDEVRRGRVMHWIRVDTWQDDAGRVISQPVPCMHCENAPCELVCPVGATQHDSEGLNVQVYNRCVGTRFCSNNCPYKVRRFNFRQYNDVATETLKLMRNPEVTVRDRGVMEKCSYCVQRLSRVRRAEQKSGEPAARAVVETACQSACPTNAIHFGDLSDPHSDVSRTKQSPRHYAMLEELNTRPRTTYLARLAARPEDDT